MNNKIYQHPFYKSELLVIEQKVIQWLLSSSPILEKLDLSPLKTQQVSTRVLFSLLHPDHLKQLSCSEISNVQGDLEKILPRMTNLESLSIWLEKFNWYSLKEARFEHLKSLSVSKIPLSILHAILPNPSSIEVLRLSEVHDLSQAAVCNFTNLKELRLSECSLSTQALEFLLAQASEIKVLDIYRAGNFSGAFKERPRYPHLEQLSIFESKVNQKLISQFF